MKIAIASSQQDQGDASKERNLQTSIMSELAAIFSPTPSSMHRFPRRRSSFIVESASSSSIVPLDA